MMVIIVYAQVYNQGFGRVINYIHTFREQTSDFHIKAETDPKIA